MKTESITNTKLKSEEPSCTLLVLSIMLVCSTLPGSMLSLPLEDLPDGPGMTGTLTCKWISQSCLLPKSSRLFGMEPPSSSEDLPPNKSNKKTSTPLRLFLTRPLKLFSHLLAKPQSWSVRQFALIWVAFPFLIWATIMDTFAFATVQFTISLVESDKDLPSRTCHTLITQSMKMEPSSASKLSNSQENPPKDSGLDLFVLVKYFIFTSYSFLYFSLIYLAMPIYPYKISSFFLIE